MPHPSWSGTIRLSLVTVPVKAYTSTEGDRGRISFNQLHDKCHSRIQYVKSCPIHGPVENAEIVKGYEYAPDQYAIVETGEINQLRSEADRAVTVDKFVAPASIDPIYFAGQTYYLVPDSKQSQKPYSVLQRAMVEEKVWGIAQVVISNREQVVVLRPVGRLLGISVLNYADAIRPTGEFEKELEIEKPSAQELKLAKTLIDMSIVADPQIESYHDLYDDRLEALVKAKIEGEEVATPPSVDHGPPVIDFMAALKASLTEKRPRSPGSKKLSPKSRVRRKTAPERRKSG